MSLNPTMAANSYLPFHSISDNELERLTNSDTVCRNYLCINEIDQIVFNPLNLEQEMNCTVNDALLFNMDNITHKFSKYIYLDDVKTKLNVTDVFSVLSMNIRSVASNLQVLIDQCLLEENNIDIMGFSETRLDNNIENLYKLKGYNMFAMNRDRKGGGVCLYVSSILNSCIIKECCLMEQFLECVCVEVNSGKDTNLFASVYRPPKGNMQDFFNALKRTFDFAVTKRYNEIYFLGDWNLDLLKTNEPGVREFMNVMYSHGCFPLTTKPTRVTNNCASLIDHIWTSHFESNINNYIIYTDVSDHFAVYSQFRNTEKNTDVYVEMRNFSERNISLFTEVVANENWFQISNISDANDAFEEFYALYKDKFHSSFPVKNTKVVDKYNRSPYISTALKNSIKEKHRLERLASKWPLSYGLRYKTYRNQLVTLLRVAKNKYFQDKFKNQQGNSKLIWNTINNLLGRNNNKSANEIKLKNNKDLTANVFNDHFLKKTESSQQQTVALQNSHRQFFNNSANISLYLCPVTREEINLYLTNLKTNTAPGYDEIPPRLLKITAQYIDVPLAHIINLCFRQGCFPDKLKIAKVIPIFKSGDLEDENNYRPISILPSISKVFEKAIVHRLKGFLEDFNLLSDNQFGFRNNKSTEKAIMQFTSKVYSNLERKRYVAGIFLDLSKAFDTLNHAILVDKLYNIGVRGIPLKLFESYLTNRKQSVYCNKKSSQLKFIDTGVPQGSILGPLLFLIYINDISNATEKFNYVLFADDTNLLLHDDNLNHLHAALNIELEKISKWVSANKLKVNAAKTNYILFQNRSVEYSIGPVYMEGCELKRVSYTKFLGIIIDENLNWKNHIQSLCLKLSKICGVMYKIRYNLTVDALKNLYYSLCYPHFIYCLSIWGCTWPSVAKEIIVMQKKILRTITYKGKHDSTQLLFNELKLLKFDYLLQYFCLLAVYNDLNESKSNRQLFKHVNHSQGTRGNNVNLMCPQHRTTLYKFSIHCFGPKCWNALPDNLKTITNLNLFKSKLKNHFYKLQNQSTNVQ